VERGGSATDRILDAAWDRFTAAGIAATTMQQIAEGAGISRVWLYQHFENRDAVVRALIRRETRRFLSGLAGALHEEADRDQLIGDAAVYTVGFLRGHELLDRILQSEPQTILPFLTVDGGPLLSMAADWAEAFLSARTTVNDSNRRSIAELLVRLVASIVLTPHVSLDLNEDAVVRRLAVALVRAQVDAAPLLDVMNE
jgi:AcrR family transcriptional regulator